MLICPSTVFLLLPLVKVREEIKLLHLAKMFLREKIKKQCWSDMTVKGKAVKVGKQCLVYEVMVYLHAQSPCPP